LCGKKKVFKSLVIIDNEEQTPVLPGEQAEQHIQSDLLP
jgi:hypothetical protein